MKAEIIAIGTELLMGYVVNTNASDIAQELLGVGIGLYYQQVVGDNPTRLKEALELASKRSDLIILTGGLGPTQDDITKEIVAKFLGVDLVLSKEQHEINVQYFKNQNRSITDRETKQGMTLKGANTFINTAGLACGVAYEKGSKKYILLPGPPHEMRKMLTEDVIPYLRTHRSEDYAIESLYLNYYGIAEAQVEEILEEYFINQTNPTLAIYAKPSQTTIRLTASASSQDGANLLNNELAKKLIKPLKEYFIGCGSNYTIENYIIDQLTSDKKTLSVAESLTGGLVLESLISIPGASKAIKGGFVTYDTRTKVDYLGVPKELIAEYTVVSAEVAISMAEKTLQLSKTDYSLSLTGVAGPDSLEGHPVGEAYIALAVKGEETKVKHLNLPVRPRHIIQEMAKNNALIFLKDYMQLKNKSK